LGRIPIDVLDLGVSPGLCFSTVELGRDIRAERGRTRSEVRFFSFFSFQVRVRVRDMFRVRVRVLGLEMSRCGGH